MVDKTLLKLIWKFSHLNSLLLRPQFNDFVAQNNFWPSCKLGNLGGAITLFFSFIYYCVLVLFSGEVSGFVFR